MKRWRVVGFVVLTAVLGLAGMGWLARRSLRAEFPPPGRLVEVGDYRLHARCEGAGSPLVILESGLGDPSMIWDRVRPALVSGTRVCVYDRAGLGWSEPSPNPREAGDVVRELHALLSAAGEKPPYVLVGHSIGGVYVQLFAHEYPKDVAGLVLVDASHEAQMERAPPEFRAFFQRTTAETLDQLGTFRPLAAAGLFALRPSMVPADPLMPEEARRAYQGTAAWGPTFLDTVMAEERAVEASFAQARGVTLSFGDLPLVVVSRGTPVLGPEVPVSEETRTAVNGGWKAMQAELAARSSRGKLVVAERSDHYVHLSQPELVIDAISAMVADLRQATGN